MPSVGCIELENIIYVPFIRKYNKHVPLIKLRYYSQGVVKDDISHDSGMQFSDKPKSKRPSAETC